MIYLADTNFLIRCWRDALSPERLRDLAPFLDSEIRLVWVVKAEFLRGAAVASHDYAQVNAFLSRHKTIWPDEDTLALYAHLYAQLRRLNTLIGPHDLWIAASARQHDLPLLTRNTAEFQRVPGLRTVSY
ncbi:MAG: type II toxin-antitoxin system VapC family toxin [Caldilineales bacterium]|nr:type II toxin-antitoxin system VapC family toxin [Caldilineales bacterium]MCW5859167.1 type II toxin-antitoxin system VapC family toxin [Caldilineales bacterium]